MESMPGSTGQGGQGRQGVPGGRKFFEILRRTMEGESSAGVMRRDARSH